MNMAETKPAPRKRPGGANISPEGRQRLSELMKQRQAKGEIDPVAAGKLGGRGNTKEKRRAAASLAEHIRSEDTLAKMRQVIDDGLDSEQAIGTRIKTLEVATKIEQEEAKTQLAEDRGEREQLTREELIERITANMAKGQMRKLVQNHAALEESMDDAEIVDGEVAA